MGWARKLHVGDLKYLQATVSPADGVAFCWEHPPEFS